MNEFFSHVTNLFAVLTVVSLVLIIGGAIGDRIFDSRH